MSTQHCLYLGLVFQAVHFEDVPYPGTSKVWGFYPARPPRTAFPITRVSWNGALKNDELDAWLTDYWAKSHNLRVGSTYEPARNNRKPGPAVYKITRLLGTQHCQVNGTLVMTAAQWKARVRATAQRAKSKSKSKSG